MTLERSALAIAAVIVFGFLLYLHATKRDPVSASSPAIAKNIENDFLLKRSPAEQARLLGEASGKGCKGTEAFFMGMDKRKIGFWSLRCADGRELMVNTNPDSTRSMVVVECELLHALKNGITCFKPLRKE